MTHIERTTAESTQNETREKTMMTYNDQAKARFPLSLDGRGARGEGVLRSAKIALAALFLAAPNAALADNECGLDDPSLNGALADSYDCPDADFPEGVTYAADGDLTVNFTNADATPRSIIGENPDNGGDDPEMGDDLTDMGGIDLSATGSDSIVFDSAATGTEIESNGVLGALLSVTTVDGNIDIDTAQVDADESAAGVTHGIFAQSTGSGNIGINTTSNVDAAGNSNPDDSIGVQAIAGTGSLTITASGTLSGNDAAIDAATGSGLLTVNVTGGSGTVGQSSDVGTRAQGGDDVLINVGTGRQINGSDTALDLTAAGDITVDNDGRIASFGGVAIRAEGNALVLNNTVAVPDGDGNEFNDDGRITGTIDLSDLTGGYTFNNNPGTVWIIGSLNDMGAGTFNNAGTVSFGSNESVILAPGTTFNGLPGSLLTMGMTLSSAGQTNCSAPTVAGCFDLSGGSTSGETAIRITSAAPPLDPAGGLTNAANPGILLVDVSGGTSADDHFVLHPDSENYLDTSFYGPVLTTGGPLVYTLLYNPNTQQHILSTVPTEEGAEYATFTEEAVSIWHTTADTVAGRQADLRDGATGGGWMRLVNETTESDASLAMTTHGNDFTFDMSYEQETRAALFGSDVMYGDTYVIGLHGGIISSETEYEGTDNGNKTKGAAAGIYGGWWQPVGIGQLTVDATVNTNFLKLDHDASYEVTHSDIMSLGVRAEAGWRLPIADNFYVQPLATVAYVRTDIEKMELRQNNISFENSESQRAALGLRLGGDFGVGNGYTAGYWLTGRAWEESVDDGHVAYATEADPLIIAYDISGSLEEIGAGLTLSSPEDKLNVYVSGGVKSGDRIDSNCNVSIGARLNW